VEVTPSLRAAPKKKRVRNEHETEMNGATKPREAWRNQVKAGPRFSQVKEDGGESQNLYALERRNERDVPTKKCRYNVYDIGSTAIKPVNRGESAGGVD